MHTTQSGVLDSRCIKKRCNLNIIVRNNYFTDDVKIIVKVIIIDTRFMVIFH